MKATTAITALALLAIMFAGTYTASAAPNDKMRELFLDQKSARIKAEARVSKLEDNLKELQAKYDALEKKFFASEGRAAKAERELHQVKAQLRAAEEKTKGQASEQKPDDLSALESKDKDKDKDKDK